MYPQKVWEQISVDSTFLYLQLSCCWGTHDNKSACECIGFDIIYKHQTAWQGVFYFWEMGCWQWEHWNRHVCQGHWLKPFIWVNMNKKIWLWSRLSSFDSILILMIDDKYEFQALTRWNVGFECQKSSIYLIVKLNNILRYPFFLSFWGFCMNFASNEFKNKSLSKVHNSSLLEGLLFVEISIHGMVSIKTTVI